MTWKEYEHEIANHFRLIYPDAHISGDIKILGKNSKVPRQIDVLVEGEIIDFPFRIIVEARFKKKKLDVNEIGEFVTKMKDVEANKGVIVALNGYTDAAIELARNSDVDLSLDVLNFAE